MSNESRRKLLKSIAAGSGAIVAAKSLPENWTKPVVDSVMLPAHAQTSPPTSTLVATVHINAMVAGPNSVDQPLPAGNFEIRPVSGGPYGDAWNPWGTVSGCTGGQNCSTGWAYWYEYSSASLGTQGFGTSNSPHETEALAFAAAQSEPPETFTLAAGETVTFEINDDPYTDNLGGISLEIYQIT